jgi:transcriptional regulator with XRE-family HTH domain
MRETTRDLARRIEDATEFDEYLAELIAVHYSSPGDLARHAGVSEGILSRWANGVRGLSHETLRKIAPFLGVTYGDLLVKAGLATPEEFPSRVPPPVPRRYAKELVEIQDFYEDERTSVKAEKRLRRRLRFELSVEIDLRDGAPVDIVDRRM